MTGNVRIRILALADGRQSPYAGRYLKSFDPEAHHGRGDLVTTADYTRAWTGTAEEAVRLWKAIPKNAPRRPDGKANRPFTAFTIQMEAVE
jgi:hypothetical protein